MLMPHRNVQIVNTRNRILTQHIQMTLDTRKTDRNNNILIVGGSGSGKTFRFVKPQIMQMFGSYIITDPKGEIFRDTSGFLRNNGYSVKVLNLLNEDEMMKSSHFNPFRYIQSEVDVLKLITNLISNTTPKGSSTNDPFWEKAEGMLLQALFYYVWLEGLPEEISLCRTPQGKDDIPAILDKINDPGVTKVHNVRAVMDLLKYADFKEDPATGAKMDSVLDGIMRDLERKNPNHKAVLNYNKVMRGAADTVRSIIISANSRLAPVQSEAILQLLDDDEMDIPLLGTQKTVIYCVIPDNDKTYNFLVGILYSMMFQQLYFEADFVHGGRLPVHVTFLLDEFCNVALPDDYLSLLSTMRSREISSIIIIQDISQIKTLFKEGQHEEIIANCDTMIYLGGNGPGTQKELSELMGKATIDKRTNGETLGKQGSTSRNYDILGRELLFPDELRKVDGNKCIAFIRGFDPVLDDKIASTEHPLWNQMCQAARGELFDARIERKRKRRDKNVFGEEEAPVFVEPVELNHLMLLDQKEWKHYGEEKRVADLTGGRQPEKPKQRVISLSLEELAALSKRMEDEEEEPFKLDEDLLLKSKEELLEKLRREKEQRVREELEKINPKDFQTPEEALAYAELKKAGFPNKNIKTILALIQQGSKYGINEILGSFDSQMDEQTVQLLVAVMLKEERDLSGS